MATKTRDQFESLGDFMNSNVGWENRQRSGNSSHRAGRADWAGTGSYEEAIEIAKRGWKQGAGRVAELRAQIESFVAGLVAAKAAAVRFDVEGEWCDIGRLAMNDPECVGSWDDAGQSQTRVVRIVANLCVSASVSKEVMFARGAAVLAATDVLESLGVRVELIVAMGMSRYYGDNKNGHEAHIVVKQANEHVETDRLAYVLCHASFFRRHMFAAMELAGYDPCDCYPAAVTAEDAIILPEVLSGKCPSMEDTKRQVIELCQQAGIVFDDEELAAAL